MMTEPFAEFRKRHALAIAAQLEGDVEPYLALWSQKPPGRRPLQRSSI